MYRFLLLISLSFPAGLSAQSYFGQPESGLSFTSLPYILPLEVKLGEYYLLPSTISGNGPRTGRLQLQGKNLLFQFFTRQSRDEASMYPGWIDSLRPGNNSRQTSLMSLTWQRHDSFFRVDLQQDFNKRGGPDDSLLVGTGLAYGHSIYSSVSLLFGMKTAGTLDPVRSSMGQVVLDYGKVFFTPGLQLRSRSVTIETFLEMPVYAYDMRNHTPEATDPHDVRANIGIRYNH